jgi:hypothetical protein
MSRPNEHQDTEGMRKTAVFAIVALMSSGCGSASTPAPAPDHGNVNFTDYSDNDGTKAKVVLTGAVGDYGDAVSLTSNGDAHGQRTDIDLNLTQGKFRINIADIDKKLVDAFTHFPSNTTTCSGLVTASGTAPIEAGSGTGAYQGISGHFDLTVNVNEVDVKDHCGPGAKFLSQTVVITGPGTVTLG